MRRCVRYCVSLSYAFNFLVFSRPFVSVLGQYGQGQSNFQNFNTQQQFQQNWNNYNQQQYQVMHLNTLK